MRCARTQYMTKISYARHKAVSSYRPEGRSSAFPEDKRSLDEMAGLSGRTRF